jgi:alkanesulfonate monooxygenase SsuD/methylene tetrahydromethanopterin reductase-like flavin-dependent oxidoreductase (luciferase family)
MATEQHSASPRGHTDRTGIRSAIGLPLFDALADPAVVARLAAEAEEAGWHGVFVWDHVRWNAPIQQVADPWITMAAIATATERVRIGPMVTPLPRRRPVKVARETATLDRLSGGRLILGVGIGLDRFAGEFSKTGEQVDDRVRGEMLDEALEILAAAWSGEPVHHHGTHYTVDDIQFLPRPVQQPGIPVWAAAFPETANRCAGPPAATAWSPPTSTTPISSPPPSPRLPRYVGPRAGRTTSPSACRSASTRRPSPRPAPPGGGRRSHRESLWTWCAACCAMDRRNPEPVDVA